VRRRRIAAYGLCRDEEGRILMVRAAGGASAGRWLLPGGGVRHGEHPADAVVREVREETGLDVVVERLRDVVTDVNYLSDIATVRHQDRLIFDVRPTGGHLRPERGGSSDDAAWVAPERLAALPLLPYAARLLGVPAVEEPPVDWPDAPAPGARHTVAADGRPRHQRFASYGLALDPAGRVLLARIASGYPGAGSWHLPGGGTDFGEGAVDGLLRELEEETDQRGRVTGLLSVSHRHDLDTLGPEGMPYDWHGVRVVFGVRVDSPSTPRVVEAAGSTAAAAWFPRTEALSLSLTEIAREMITTHGVPHENRPA
jgi:8-oxo-dGTP diphosphatase